MRYCKYFLGNRLHLVYNKFIESIAVSSGVFEYKAKHLKSAGPFTSLFVIWKLPVLFNCVPVRSYPCFTHSR
jgi:hypothetical protein